MCGKEKTNKLWFCENLYVFDFEILDYYKTAIGYLDNIFLFEILKRPVNQRYTFKYLIPEVYVVVDLH